MTAPAIPSAPDADLFVARQPIFDRAGQVYGYELLFRSSLENVCRFSDPDAAATDTIGTGLLGFGLDLLVGGALAFVNVTREVLLGDVVTLLPPERTVLELLEHIEPDDEVLAACQRLRAAGYRLALDDFSGEANVARFAPYVDLVKIDCLDATPDGMAALAARGRATGKPYLAERVETRELWRAGMDHGFSWFQGYFFCRPEVVAGRRVPANQFAQLELLQAIAAPDLDFERLEGIIRRDVGLSVTLLRYLNSAAFGWRERVDSIHHALRLLGETSIKRWALLATMMHLGREQPVELVTIALVRAHFAEALAAGAKLDVRRLDAFLTGLLVGLDAVLGRPLPEILAGMSLPDPVRDALIDRQGVLGELLRYVLAYERAEWEEAQCTATALGLDESISPRLYAESTRFAHVIKLV